MPNTLLELRRKAIAQTLFETPDLKTGIERCVFVQADPIRAPARAQDLILRQRVTGYQAGDLEAQYPELGIEEDYFYAYGFLTRPLRDALHPRPKKSLTATEQRVLDHIRSSGPIHPKELQRALGAERVTNAWGGFSQAGTRALEALRHHGLLRVSRRERGIRLYECAPDQPESASDEKRFSQLLLATARICGPTSAKTLLYEVSHYTHIVKTPKQRRILLEQLKSVGALESAVVDNVEYIWSADCAETPETPDRVRILAPFDPLVRDRSRFEHLWNWTYRFEAYTPVAKRKLGYYALPLLWRDAVVGWVNAKVVAKRLELEIGFVEKRPREKAFKLSLEIEAAAFAIFLKLEEDAWTLSYR